LTGNAAQAAQQSILGAYTGMALQAMVVGKSLVGMRSDDAIRAINWLVSLPDVQQSSITIYGRAAEGMVALHTAALDTRIAHVVLDSALVSYHMALESPLHRNLSEIVLPGVLLKYDTSDLIDAIGPRSVEIVNPVDSIGVAARDEAVKKELAAVFESDRKLDTSQRVRVIRRGPRDPLPIE
jgi:dienelactone hydrolase